MFQIFLVLIVQLTELILQLLQMLHHFLKITDHVLEHVYCTLYSTVHYSVRYKHINTQNTHNEQHVLCPNMDIGDQEKMV